MNWRWLCSETNKSRVHFCFQRCLSRDTALAFVKFWALGLCFLLSFDYLFLQRSTLSSELSAWKALCTRTQLSGQGSAPLRRPFAAAPQLPAVPGTAHQPPRSPTGRVPTAARPLPCLHARPRGSLPARRPRAAQLGTRRAGGGGGAEAQPRARALVPTHPAPLAAGGGRARSGGRAAERGGFVCGKVWRRGGGEARPRHLPRGGGTPVSGAAPPSRPAARSSPSLAAGHGRLAAAVPAQRRAGRRRRLRWVAAPRRAPSPAPSRLRSVPRGRLVLWGEAPRPSPGVSGRLPAGPARAGVRLPPPAILAASPRAVRPVPPPPPHGARGAERSRGGASAAAPRIGCPSACGAVRLRPRAAVPSARLGLRHSRQGGGHLRARRELLWIHRRTAGGFFQSGLRGVLAFLRTVGFERQSMEGERAPRAPCPVPIAGGGALPDLGLGDASCLFPKWPTLRMRLSV